MVTNFKGSNILVTGGTGFVGSHLIEELIHHQSNIITTFLNIDPRSYFSVKNLQQTVTLANVDVTDYEAVFDLITKFKVDYIFHLAAQPLVDVAYNNPAKTLKSNILGTINILESVRNYSNIKGVVIASSDKAYGKLNKEKYSELDPLIGDHPYEVSKSAADLISQAYFKTYKIPVIISRFGNIYGEGDLNFSRIIPSIMKAIITDEVLELRSNGKHVRDYLYVKDVVKGYIKLASNIEKFKGEAFNFGSDETLSVLELIQKIEQVLDKKVSYKILNNAQNEISYQSLNYSKTQNKLGWTPKGNISNTAKGILGFYFAIL